MNLDEIRELIALLEDSSLTEIEIEEEGNRIRLMKNTGSTTSIVYPGGAPGDMALSTQVLSSTPAQIPGQAPTPAESQEELLTIDSPMVGTFYNSSGPGKPAFVSVGDTADETQTIGIVEAMKIMNEVAAPFPCMIEKIMVENGEAVEFGQPLYSIKAL